MAAPFQPTASSIRKRTAPLKAPDDGRRLFRRVCSTCASNFRPSRRAALSSRLYGNLVLSCAQWSQARKDAIGPGPTTSTSRDRKVWRKCANELDAVQQVAGLEIAVEATAAQCNAELAAAPQREADRAPAAAAAEHKAAREPQHKATGEA